MANSEYRTATEPDEFGAEVSERIISVEEEQRIAREVKNDAVKGLIQQLGGALSALILLLGTLNIQFEWLTPESVEAFTVVLGAFVAFGVSLFTIYKNSFSGKKAQRENQKLKEEKVIKEHVDNTNGLS